MQDTEESITKAELPHTIAMIVPDVAAPNFLLIGLDKYHGGKRVLTEWL